MGIKSRTADLIYSLMVNTTSQAVSDSAKKIMDAIQLDRTENQVLGLAACLIIMLHHYDLSHIDVLGIADNIVYSGTNNNMLPDFKAIKRFMKNEWEI
jgi:hypothetical protein